MGSKQKETKEKPLEKMTATELRDTAGTIPEITGAHGMNKAELISAIKQSRGIEEVEKKSSSSLREIKAKIKDLRARHEEAIKKDDKKSAEILKKKISKLKKRTRKAA